MLKKFHIILCVAAFIIDSKKRLLIVKKSPHEHIDAGLWTVPGGKVEPQEGIIPALKRETKEEVNLDIISHQWLYEDVFISSGIYFHGEHFLCSVKKTTGVKLDGKLEEYRWITKNQINDFQYHPNIKREIIHIFTKILPDSAV